MALAQSIIEYIASKTRAKTMFSTHYHEITSIDKRISVLKNVHVSVATEGDKITLLYKIENGAMGKSYGLNVARLAHLPEELLVRANEILKGFEENGVETDHNVMQREEKKEEEWIKDVKKMDPLSMSPFICSL